ncbi:isopentenyl phosphate kinase [Methanobrevibacter curvatus]|uniref:Isopentenyl phosphate kinase n=1 Tax=Methanobrevibacter curvatus TaxID=49547 RepID=A0A162FK77_9EURY|nr:isopentenyl phosphate kinase [Methanobrevibacter curvatus]KZX11240.1 glutamate 5-kinase [Methanobrevibacter curvatus]
MIILKLGGSVITDKNSLTAKLDFDNLNRIAVEISNYLKSYDSKLIIIHGAGSFGHPPAKKYKIGEKFNLSNYQKKRIGFSQTQLAVKTLNSQVLNVLIKNNIPAVSIQTSSILTTNNKRIDSFNIDLVNKYLDEGYVPVLYGDVAIDKSLKMAVVSGDQIITYLGKYLNPDKIILASDVDGVYNKNPKTNSDAKLFKCLSSLKDLEQFDSTTNIDVTGGMIGKIRELLELSKEGVDSFVINANTKNNIFNILNDDEVNGTLITNKCNK